MLTLAGLLAIGAVWLCWTPASVQRLRPAPPARSGMRVRPPAVLGLAATGAVVVGGLLDGVRGAVLGWAVGVTAAAAAWTVLQARTARRRVRTRDQVASGCGELAGLLRAGYVPVRALELVARDAPLFAEVAAHHRVGGDVIEALRGAARRPGASGLLALAASWQISERTGASMTTSLDDLAANLAAERELARTVTTELAAARLTGRLLGMLPMIGLVLGYAVGGDPLGYLTGSAAGLACLAIGAGLAAAGVVWSEALAERAGRLR
ncbi:MAG: type II secretion system F family protein [Micropruina sp.]|uniref:type II secretion system F family protein n=1 Tax=Micropruina sp. TaxID=2737536 RepID=UPI0039E3C0F4